MTQESGTASLTLPVGKLDLPIVERLTPSSRRLSDVWGIGCALSFGTFP